MVNREAQDWFAEANCLGANPDIFLPERGEGSSVAKAICAECVVQEPCLDYALVHKEKGVWGGTSEKERRLIKKTGFTAVAYLQGRLDGTISKPRKGRPISTH